MDRDTPQIYTPRVQSLGSGVHTPPPLTNPIASTQFPESICFIDETGTVQHLTLDNGQVMVHATQYTNAVALAGGFSFVLILHADGHVSCLDLRDEYGVANVPNHLDHVIAISAGLFSAYALRSDKRVVAWGRNDNLQAERINFYTHIHSVVGGRHHVMFTHIDGTLTYVGNSGYNERDTTPQYRSDIRMIGGSDLCALAWLNDGSVVDLFSAIDLSDEYLSTYSFHPIFGEVVTQLACSKNLYAILTSDSRAIIGSQYDVLMHSLPNFSENNTTNKWPVIIENVAHIVGTSNYMFVVLSNGSVRMWADSQNDPQEVIFPDTVRCRVV